MDRHKSTIWQSTDGKWYTYLPNKKLIKRKSKEDLEKYLIDYYNGNVALYDVYNAWVTRKYEKKEIVKHTKDTYDNIYKKFIAGQPIEQIPIKKITYYDLEDLVYGALDKNDFTPKAFANMRTVILGTFKYARRKHITELSITYFFRDLDIGKKTLKKRKRRAEEEVFNEDEIALVTDWLRENPTIENLGILLVFYTGIRMGELSALKYSDYDGTTLHVQRQEIKYKSDETGKNVHEIVDYTKTEAGDRKIILPEQAKEIIEQIHLMNPEAEYLMQVGKRKIWTNTFNDRLYRCCDELCIPRRSMHKIRKTYGTTLIDAGVEDSLIMSQMGHSDIETTRKYYYFANQNFDKKVEAIKKAIDY